MLKLTTEFTQQLRSETNPEEDHKHTSQMYVDVIAIAKRTWDAQEHCDAHLKELVRSRMFAALDLTGQLFVGLYS